MVVWPQTLLRKYEAQRQDQLQVNAGVVCHIHFITAESQRTASTVSHMYMGNCFTLQRNPSQ